MNNIEAVKELLRNTKIEVVIHPDPTYICEESVEALACQIVELLTPEIDPTGSPMYLDIDGQWRLKPTPSKPDPDCPQCHGTGYYLFSLPDDVGSPNRVKCNCWNSPSKDLLLSDQEIRMILKQAMDEAQEYGDDGEPLPERLVAKAQLAHCEQRVREDCQKLIEEIVEWVNVNLLTPDWLKRWNDRLDGWRLEHLAKIKEE
jgi:hypothetical protein